MFSDCGMQDVDHEQSSEQKDAGMEEPAKIKEEQKDIYVSTVCLCVI